MQMWYFLGFFDYLNQDEITVLLEDSDFVELVHKLNKNSDGLLEEMKIYKFYTEHVSKKLKSGNKDKILQNKDYF